MEKIAIISDIHGNIPALETVLQDISERGISRIYCLGDIVGKGPHPEKAMDICREVCEVIVQGNHDEIISSDREFPSADWQRERLGPERMEYLRNLPGTFDFVFSGRRIRLYHASHISVHHRVHMNAPEEEQEAMFTSTEFTGDGFEPDTVGYGDIHQIYIRNRFGKVLFNAGSVGNPLDEPLAAYIVLEGNPGTTEPGYFSMDMIRLPYDIELSIKMAKDEGMPDTEPWEDELRTGRYRRDPASRAWRQHVKT